MVDWYEVMRSEYDKEAPRSSRGAAGRVADALLSADVPSEKFDLMQSGESTGEGTLFTFRLHWLLVPLIVWMLGYISGAFPYLGKYAYNRGNGEITYSLQTPSPRIMPLFKGQTAFIDYKVDSLPGFDGNVMFDIRPWPGLAHSQDVIVISGKKQGRLEVPITRTDYYQFSFTTMPMSHQQEMTYSATWGAQ